MSTSYYPLSLLLSLLGSEVFLKNTGMMDSLVALLAIVTRPLITELQKAAEAKEELQEATQITPQNGENQVPEACKCSNRN